MYSSRRKNSSKILRRADAIALTVESTKKPRRRICQLATSSPDSDDNDLREIYSSLPRFGPFYSGDESVLWTGKEEAWQHLLRKSPVKESETIQIYLSAMKRIEQKARDTYPDDTLDHLSTLQFRWMMIKDGCFILQLALYGLGGSAQLDHPHDDLIFGENRNPRNINRWIKSMFFVGNQIPLLVLMELMKQEFFRNVVVSGKWEQPSDLFKRVLYELLLLPALERSHQRTFTTLTQGLKRKLGLGTKYHLLQHQASDLLHGLQLLVLGPRNDQSEDENEEADVEGDGEDFGGSITIRCGTELRQAGIHFKNAKEIGSRGINFNTNMFCAVLTLPTLVVDDDTELLFRYLKNYEISQQLGRNKREVSSYLQFMSELVRTPDDAKLLTSRGIVRANPNQREKLPGILNRLASQDTTRNLRIARLQIDDYSRPPWEKIRNFLSLVLLLTVVQTVYTVLGYYKNP